MLEIKNLTKKYSSQKSEVEALRGIDLSVGSGEFISIVGPSGSGKTTLLKIIAGLIKPEEGIITLDSQPIRETSAEVGMVFQQFSLFPWLTVEENIAFGLKIKSLPAGEIRKTIDRYLLLTGLVHFKDSYPSALSGGMQQRVAIARTLANDPKIILLDEPFGALDVQTRSQMQEFLAKIWEEERKTMILITHDVEEALYVSDKVVVLSTKPGSVKEVVDVPFPRPRRSEIRYEKEFVTLKKYINYGIRSESIKASTDIRSLNPANKQLIIGSNIWTGVAPFYLAKEMGLFAQNKLETQIATLEWSIDRMKPWREGKVDALDTPLDSALIEYSKSPDLRIFMVLDVSHGGDAIIGKKSLSSVADLKGRTIGIEKEWVSHFFLNFALHKAGLTSADVTVKDVKASDIGSEIIAGRIDAASIQEPWLSKAHEYANTRIIATTKDYAPIIYAVLIVKADILQKKRAEFEKLRTIWVSATAFLKEETYGSIKMIAPYFGISEIELSEQLDQLTFVDPSTDLSAALEETQEILLKEGILAARLNLKGIIAY